MIRSLESTGNIWRALSDGTSIEAIKASNILSIMLAKIKEPAGRDSGRNPSSTDTVAKGGPAGSGGFDDMSRDQSAAAALGMLSGAPTPNTAAALGMMQGPGGVAFTPPGMGLGSSSDSTGLSPDFSADMLGLNPGSPLSMFNNMIEGSMNFAPNTGELDWVWSIRARSAPCIAVLSALLFIDMAS